MSKNALIYDMAMAANTNDRHYEVIKYLEDNHAARPIPVGNTPANAGAIGISSDSVGALAELLTNAFDANTEQARLISGKNSNSIIEAAQVAGVSPGGLGAMPKGQRRALAKRTVELTLMDSDDSGSKPTIQVRDFGTGVAREEFNTTLGSLHKTNKFQAMHQHGQFGQGAQQSWPYSSGGLIIVRPTPEQLKKAGLDRGGVGADLDRVLIVPFSFEFVDIGNKQKTLVYWVLSDGNPFSVPASETDFEPGVLRRLINYRCGESSRVSTASEKSMVAKLQSALAVPAMPWIYRDARSDANTDDYDSHINGQTMVGVSLRLRESSNLETDRNIRQSLAVDLGGVSGSVDMEIFAFSNPDHVRRIRAQSQTILLTINGQTHAYLSTGKTRNMCTNLDRCLDSMVVVVDCTNLDREVINELFTSSRDSLDRGDLGTLFAKQIIEAVDTNNALLALERNLESEALSKVREDRVELSADDYSDFAREFDADMFHATGLGGKEFPKPQVLEVEEFPQCLMGPSTITLMTGSKRITRSYITRARDNFIPDEGVAELIFADGAEPEGITWRVGSHVDGRFPLIFSVEEDVEEASFDATLRLSWPDGMGGQEELNQDLTIEVIERVAKDNDDIDSGDDNLSDNDGKPAILMLGNDYEGFDETVPGEFKRMSASLVAKQSEHYDHLANVEGEIDVVIINKDFGPLVNYFEALAANKREGFREARQREYTILLAAEIAGFALDEREIAEEQSLEDSITKDQQKRVFSHIAMMQIRSLTRRDNLSHMAPARKKRRKKNAARTNTEAS